MALDAFEGLLHGRVKAASKRLLWTGIALLVIGIVAVVFPVFSTFIATGFAGAFLLVSGIVLLMAAFSIHGTGPFFAALLSGLLSTAAGAFLVFNPVAGSAALTMVIAAAFIFQAAFEVFFAFELPAPIGRAGLIFSATTSAVVGILIAAGWPATSFFALGILLGVNFITTGAAYISLSRAVGKPWPTSSHSD